MDRKILRVDRAQLFLPCRTGLYISLRPYDGLMAYEGRHEACPYKWAHAVRPYEYWTFTQRCERALCRMASHNSSSRQPLSKVAKPAGALKSPAAT
jgi:hypothetical protein